MEILTSTSFLSWVGLQDGCRAMGFMMLFMEMQMGLQWFESLTRRSQMGRCCYSTIEEVGELESIYIGISGFGVNESIYIVISDS